MNRILSTLPVFLHYNPDAPIGWHTHASGDGIGAILAQHHGNDPMKRAVAYVRHTFSKGGRDYSTTEKTSLEIVPTVGKFLLPLYGRPLRVVTDYHALCWL